MTLKTKNRINEFGDIWKIKQRDGMKCLLMSLSQKFDKDLKRECPYTMWREIDTEFELVLPPINEKTIKHLLPKYNDHASDCKESSD